MKEVAATNLDPKMAAAKMQSTLGRRNERSRRRLPIRRAPARAPLAGAMSSLCTIQRFVGQFTALFEGTSITYITPKSVLGAPPAIEVIGIGSYVKYYDYLYERLPGDFEGPGYSVGRLSEITNDIWHSCKVAGICGDSDVSDGIHLHHIRLANAHDIARAVFRVGVKVVVLDSGNGATSLIGTWDSEKDAAVGLLSTVSAIDADGALRLREFEHCSFSPEHVRVATDAEVSARFRVGNRVTWNEKHKELPGGDWVSGMTNLTGQVGEVRRVDTLSEGKRTYLVQTETGQGWYLEGFLRLVEPNECFDFKVGDSVVCDERPTAPAGLPLWTASMTDTLGIVGRVTGLADGKGADRHYRVSHANPNHSSRWYLRRWLRAVGPAEKAAREQYDAALADLAAAGVPGDVAEAKLHKVLRKRKDRTKSGV